MELNRFSFIDKKNLWLVLSSAMCACFFYGLTQFGPEPKITTLILRNHENFFSIPILKLAKSEYQVKAPKAAISIGDDKLKKYIKNVTIYPDWLKKNIVINYALSKDDAKELVDTTVNNDRDLDQNFLTESSDAVDENVLRSQLKASRYKISNIGLEIISFDSEFAQQAIAWVGKVLINLNEYLRYQQLVEFYRSENEKRLLHDSASLPNLELSLNAIDAHINKVRELMSKNPELARQSVDTQLSISTESMLGSKAVEQAEPPEKIYRPTEQATYLPLQTQLAGLEVQQAQATNLLERLRFKILISVELVNVSSKELERLSGLSATSLVGGSVEKDDFYKAEKLNEIISGSDFGWKKNYVEDLLRDIDRRIVLLKQQSQGQMLEIKNISSRKIVPESIYTIGITLFGLLLPFGLRYLPRLFSKIYA
jgi:hypothetical protein